MQENTVGEISQELQHLIQRQLDVLHSESFSRMTDADLLEYRLRYTRIQELCQKLGAVQN